MGCSKAEHQCGCNEVQEHASCAEGNSDAFLQVRRVPYLLLDYDYLRKRRADGPECLSEFYQILRSVCFDLILFTNI